MYHAYNEKRKTTKDGRNRSTKSRKNQNAQRKGNLQILGNIGSRHHQISGDEGKNKEELFWRARKLLETKLFSRHLIKGMNTRAVLLVRYSGPFLKWTREEL